MPLVVDILVVKLVTSVNIGEGLNVYASAVAFVFDTINDKVVTIVKALIFDTFKLLSHLRIYSY